MFYSVRHITKFRYATAVSESGMETRMHPRTDGSQLCLNFHLSVSPRCRLFSYRDYLGNHIHHFDIPVPHQQLVIVAESLVEVQPPQEIPASMAQEAWIELDTLVGQEDCWEMLLPSEFITPTPLLEKLRQQLAVRRRDDPLTVMRQLNEDLCKAIEYAPKSTRVNSPIDEALHNRKGVCQDFAHIMIALVRSIGIPCRYVSGYIHQQAEDANSSGENATRSHQSHCRRRTSHPYCNRPRLFRCPPDQGHFPRTGSQRTHRRCPGKFLNRTDDAGQRIPHPGRLVRIG